MDRFALSRLRALCIFGAVASGLLCSCASMDQTTSKRAYCNTLKSNIIFNGATGVDREANIQTSEKLLQQSNYDNHCN